jgi:hypothetical protein
MDKFKNYLKQFDIMSAVTDEEVERTVALLLLYSPTLRRSARKIEETEGECFDSRRQSVSDFIDLAIDYDHDSDRKRIVERLNEIGHSMELLTILERALMLVKSDPAHGKQFYRILQMRYFNAYCNSNEDAFLSLGISSSTFYRNIRPAIRLFAANLWCVVIPDMIIAERQNTQLHDSPNESLSGSQTRVS